MISAIGSQVSLVALRLHPLPPGRSPGHSLRPVPSLLYMINRVIAVCSLYTETFYLALFAVLIFHFLYCSSIPV